MEHDAILSFLLPDASVRPEEAPTTSSALTPAERQMAEPATLPRVQKRKGQSKKAPAKKKAPLRRQRQPAIPPLAPSAFYNIQQRSRGVSPPPDTDLTLDRPPTNEPEHELDETTGTSTSDQRPTNDAEPELTAEPEPETPTPDTDKDHEQDHDTDNGNSDDSDDGPRQPRLMRGRSRVMTLATSSSDVVSYLNYAGFIHFNDFGLS